MIKSIYILVDDNLTLTGAQGHQLEKKGGGGHLPNVRRSVLLPLKKKIFWLN